MRAGCIYIIVLFIHTLTIQAMSMPGDSIVGVDSLQAWMLNQKAHEEFRNNNLDRALFLSQTSLQDFYDDLKLAADNYHLMASIYKLQGSQENAIKYYLRTINAYEKLNSVAELIKVYRETGDYFFSLGAYMKAPEYYQKAYSMAKADTATNLLIAMGTSYFHIPDYDKSRNAFETVLPLLSPQERAVRLKVLTYLSMICTRQNNYNQSLIYDQEILKIKSQINDEVGILIANNNIAFDYVHLKNYSAAIAMFKQSLILAENHKNDPEALTELYSNIGICYQNANDNDNALINLQKAYAYTEGYSDLLSKRAEIENMLAITYYYKNDYYNAELYSRNSIISAQTCRNKELLQSCYLTYSQILKAGNDYIKALEYYELHLSLKDSLEREYKVKEQNQSQKNLDVERTEKELRLKLADEEITEVQLKRMKLEAEKKQQELDLLRKQRELEISENERILQSLVLTRQQHEAELRNREMKSLEQEKAIQELKLKHK